MTNQFEVITGMMLIGVDNPSLGGIAQNNGGHPALINIRIDEIAAYNKVPDKKGVLVDNVIHVYLKSGVLFTIKYEYKKLDKHFKTV